MGWGKIVKKVKSVGHKIEPHAAAITLLKEKTSTGARVQKNIEQEGTKGVANYGGYAALALQVVPGVGTAVGLGVAGLTAAAQLKMRQDAARKVNQTNKRINKANKAIAAGEPIEAFNPDGTRKKTKQGTPIIAQSTSKPTTVVNAGSAFTPNAEEAGAFSNQLMGQFAPQLGGGGVPAASFAGAPADSGVALVPNDAASDDTTMWLLIGGGVLTLGVVTLIVLRK